VTVYHSQSHSSVLLAATVRAAKAFFARMDEMQKRVAVKKPKTEDPEAVALYAAALDILDKYLDLVELPPIDSGHYDKDFDTLVGETARITQKESFVWIFLRHFDRRIRTSYRKSSCWRMQHDNNKSSPIVNSYKSESIMDLDAQLRFELVRLE